VGVDTLCFDDPLPAGARQVSGRVMGSDFHVLAVGGPSDLPARARARLEELEARWSRFQPDSELTRLSSSGAKRVTVSTDTWQLVAAMVTAWERTRGRCDATVLPAIAAAGYDQDLGALPRDRPATSIVREPAQPSPGLGEVELDRANGSVRLPPGVGLDPGAVGKGLAADLVVADLIEAGARGALVNVGGDLVVAGEPVDHDAWTVELQLTSGPSVRWTLRDGAVATSSSRRRHWLVDGQRQHHLIDPATSRPISDPPATVSTVTGEGWWAEAAATAITVGGVEWARTWAPANAVTGLVEDADGERHLLPGGERFLS
jgi:thiamine biosynthesis lipoprotein